MMGAESARSMLSVLAVVNKRQCCPKLHLVGSLYVIVLMKVDDISLTLFITQFFDTMGHFLLYC